MTPTLEKLPNYNRLKSTDLKALLEEKRYVCVSLVTAARTNTSVPFAPGITPAAVLPASRRHVDGVTPCAPPQLCSSVSSSV